MIGKGRILVALAAVSLAFNTALGVTEKEMEQARVIAAQAYLRYANDGSGYLDDVKVSTMAELESKLKKTEKDNLVAFKSAANPTGYASWTKDQLLEYWGDTFFRSPALTEKGKMAKSRVKKRIGAMSIAAPVAETAPQAAATVEEKVEQDQQPEEEPKQESQASMPAEFAATAQSIDSVATALQEDADEFEQRKSERSSNTWVYVVILAVLVGIVVWLVVFASKMMKNSSVRNDREREERDDDHVVTDLRARALAAQSEISRLRSEIDRITSEKDTEISTLRSRCEQSAFEVSRLRAELTDARSRLAAAEARSTSVESVMPEQLAPSVTMPRGAAASEKGERKGGRTIYLGRVNASGLFVRADRGVVLGHTVYRLDTTDGFSGTFRVVNNPQVWETLMRNPGEMLSGGCVCEDLLETDGFDKIVTESAGTAIFENGCWRVLRQCRIIYE